eukprot:3341267-Rhodomonas_salina.1
MEDVTISLIFHLNVEEGVNWRLQGSRIFDTFFWIEENTGLVQLLDTESNEGFCRCCIGNGMWCGPECEM